jgi:hypothetical protein
MEPRTPRPGGASRTHRPLAGRTRASAPPRAVATGHYLAHKAPSADMSAVGYPKSNSTPPLGISKSKLTSPGRFKPPKNQRRGQPSLLRNRSRSGAGNASKWHLLRRPGGRYPRTMPFRPVPPRLAYSFQQLTPSVNNLHRNAITYTNFQQLTHRCPGRGRRLSL